MTIEVMRAEVEELASAFNTPTFPKKGKGTYALSTSCPFTCPVMTAVEPELPAETLITVTLMLFEVGDPGPRLVTLIGTVPTWETVAVPVAVSWLVDTKLVARATPPKFTKAPDTKLLPLAVRVKSPTGIKVGETEL